MDKLDLNLLSEMRQQFAKQYEIGAIGICPWHIQVREESMVQVAPLSEWSLNIPRECDTYPYEHRVTVGGTLYIAISADPIKANED